MPDDASSTNPEDSPERLRETDEAPRMAPGSSARPWAPPSPEELQEQISQYKVLSILGCGGMGAVYQAWQISLERYVAIKILPPNVDGGDAHFVARFKQEAKTMARFQHPGIVSIYDAGETLSGLLFIVMEFIEGTDVAQMTRAQGKLPPEHALAIAAHVCDALQYAHSHGVIHRDIKPANVLINMEGAVKVADFGLAKANDIGQAALTMEDMTMGTPEYLAPEAMVMGIKVDGRADLYAVGVMLYYMLTGKLPRGAFQMPSVLTNGGTDERFDAIIVRAMDDDRDKRYQTAAEIRQDLDVILSTPKLEAHGQSSSVIPKNQLAVVRKGVVHQKPVARRPGAALARSPQGQVVTFAKEKNSALPAILVGMLIAVVAYLGWEKFGHHRAVPGADGSSAPASVSVSASTTTSTPSALLPEGVLTFGAHRYKFLPGPFWKGEDRDKAAALGGHLVTITSAEEEKWIEETFSGVISINSRGQCGAGGNGTNEGAWSWVSGEPWRYTNWRADFPNPKESLGVLALKSEGGVLKWINTYWTDKRSALVEWDDMTTPIPAEALSAALASATPAPADALLFGGHRYMVVPGYVSWNEAKDQAAALGGHLATLTTAEENGWVRKTFVDDLPKERLVHIGGYKPAGSSPWLWITGEPWSFENLGNKSDNADARGAAFQNFSGGKSHWNAAWSATYKIGISSGPEQGQPRTVGFLVEWDSDRVSSPVLAAGSNPPSASGHPADSLAFGGHRYKWVPDKSLTWTQANAAAAAMGGHLATITSKEESDWIASNVITKFDLGLGAWIGGTSEGTPGKWRWVTGEPFTFTAWNLNEPSNSDIEPALTFSKSDDGALGWGDIKETGMGKKDRRAGYLVEWDHDNIPAPALASSPSTSVNLLDGMDVTRDAVSGQWELKPEGLLTTRRGTPSLSQTFEFNHSPPPTYDFEIEFTVNEGKGEVWQILPLPSGPILWKMGAYSGDPLPCVFGPNLDGKSATHADRTEAVGKMPRFVAGQRHRCVIEVRTDSLRAVVDDTEVVRWSGNFTRFKGDDNQGLKDASHPGVGAWDTGVVFHKVELRPDELASRLARIEAQFHEAFERDVTKGSTGKAIADLDRKYLAAIDRAIADATKAGKLEDVVSLREEKQRVADKAPLPPADPVNIVASLGRLRGTYRKSVAPLAKQREAATDPVYARYDTALEAYQTELTQKNRVGDALAVKARRDGLEKMRHPAATSPLLAATTAITATPQAAAMAAAPEKEKPKKTATPVATVLPPEMLNEPVPKPFTPAEAVQWALSLGGSARIKKGSGESEIPEISRIPKGNFTLIGLKLGEKQPLHVVSLAALSSLAELRELTLDNNLITDAGLAFLPKLPKLSHLSVNGCGLTDAGLAHVSRQVMLTELSARDNSIAGSGLQHLTELPLLSILQIGSGELTNEGVPFLASLTALQRLDLSCRQPLKVESLAALAGIKKLKSLTLGSSANDACVRSLGALEKLEALDLNHAPVSDVAMDGVAAMKGLKELILFRCPNLTDYGFTKLVTLRGLLKLDVGHTRLTDSGFKTLSMKLSEIEEINAGADGMSDGGLAGLENMHKISRLEVHVRMCTDVGTSYIRRVSGLRIIGIEQVESLNPARMAALKKDLPYVNFGRQ